MRPARRLARFPMIGLALLSAGCETPAPTEYAGVPVDTYVMVVSELADIRRFPPSGSGPEERAAAADSLRQQVLDRYGLTAEHLVAFAEEAGSRPTVMEDIMERVVAVTDSLAAERALGNRGDDDLADAVGDSTTSDSATLDSATADPTVNRGPADGLARFREGRLRREEAIRRAAARALVDSIAEVAADTSVEDPAVDE